jgi:hypothetical protein
MSTNSCIAIPDGESIKGRYCHWDGYASHMAKNLWAIVKRDGLEIARRVLTIENTEWSTINVEEVDKKQPSRYTFVEGYGSAFADSHESAWIDGEEWTYVLANDKLRIVYDNEIIDVPWTFDEPDWKAIEQRLYRDINRDEASHLSEATRKVLGWS